MGIELAISRVRAATKTIGPLAQLIRCDVRSFLLYRAMVSLSGKEASSLWRLERSAVFLFF